jgi:hypothetical protein
MFHKSGTFMETEQISRALPWISFGVPSIVALPPSSPQTAPIDRDAPLLEALHPSIKVSGK